MNHESIKDQMAKELKGRNWVTQEQVEKIKDTVLGGFPDADIEVTQEHFVITRKDGVKISLPRWHKIPVSEDGKTASGSIAIEEKIENILAGE
jgi:hypothetical protein